VQAPRRGYPSDGSPPSLKLRRARGEPSLPCQSAKICAQFSIVEFAFYSSLQNSDNSCAAFCSRYLEGVPKTTALSVFVLTLIFFSVPKTALCARSEEKIATRIDTVMVKMAHRKLLIEVSGMAPMKSLLRKSGRGRLLRRNADNLPNKEGLLEYELVSNPTPNYSGTLKPVNASLKESSVPAGIKGVRVFAQYNHVDKMIAEPTKKKGFQLFRRQKKDQVLEQDAGT
jgi:hypothetical protein